jgi:hypothetical protein
MLNPQSKWKAQASLAVIAGIGSIVALPFLLSFKWNKPAVVSMKPSACAVFIAADIQVKWITPNLCQAHVQAICTPATGCQWGYKSLDGSKTVQLNNPGDEVVATTIIEDSK